MEHIQRKDLLVGMLVEIESHNSLQRGYIKDILTKTNHAQRVKVQLKTGEVGYVCHLITKEEMKMERMKYYNQFFYEKTILSIWDKKVNKYLIQEEVNERKKTTERFAYLFTDEAIAKSVLSSLNNDCYMIRSINRNKPISENFKTLNHTHYRINEERKITVKNLDEREHHYSMLMPRKFRRKRR